jgi:response regulator RpfG family c-di-GMP phosphodiesterase
MIPPGPRPTVLVVSESPRVLDDLRELLGTDKGLEITCAISCKEAGQAASSRQPDLLICQCQAHPECPGTCRVIRDGEGRAAPLFLLVSERMEPSEIARFLDQGADDYLEMSLCGQLLLPKVHSLLRGRYCQQDLWEEKRRLTQANGVLRKNFKEMASILLKILDLRIPGANDRAEAAKAMAFFLADRLALDDGCRKQTLFAALLHEVGKIGLPDDILCRGYGTSLPAALVPTYQQYTTVGSMIVSSITGYKESAEAVYHQLENYDGSGFPAGLMGEEIPLGARILRAIVLVEGLYGQGCSVGVIVERVRLSMHVALDQRIANPLIEFLLAKTGRVDTDKLKMPVDKLAPGMEIAEDVYAASGVKLLPKGVTLQEKMLALLLERHVTDPIIGGVYVLTAHS